MSTCLIITQGDKMYIGSDSACSVETTNGFRRYSDDVAKLFCLNEQIFFCSGNMKNVYECVNWINNQFTHSICIKEIKNYLFEKYDKQKGEYYDIEMLIADYNTKTVYQLSQYNNFDVVIYPYSTQTRIICGGYKTSESFSLAKENILTNKSVYDIYIDTYNNIVDECVGGYLYLYSSPTCFVKTKLIENNIKYASLEKMHLLTSEFVTSGFVNGSQMIGGEVYSENYSNDKDNPKGTYWNLNDGTFSIGSGKIKYDGETLSLSDVILKWKDIEDANDYVTTITENTVTTEFVNALDIEAGSVKVENLIGETIIGKTFIVGGEDNGDGSIVVKDAEGNIIVTIDKNGISYKDGALGNLKDEEYILLAGSVLVDGLDSNGFVVQNSSLYSACKSVASDGVVPESGVTKYTSITNINLTDYNTLTITSVADSSNFGAESETYVMVGIDGTDTLFFDSTNWGDGDYKKRTHVIQLDVSTFTGYHTLNFKQYAHSKFSVSNYPAVVDLGLTSIILS